MYRYNEEVIILEVGDSELDLNHPEGAFTIWWQTGQGVGKYRKEVKSHGKERNR